MRRSPGAGRDCGAANPAADPLSSGQADRLPKVATVERLLSELLLKCRDLRKSTRYSGAGSGRAGKPPPADETLRTPPLVSLKSVDRRQGWIGPPGIGVNLSPKGRQKVAHGVSHRVCGENDSAPPGATEPLLHERDRQRFLSPRPGLRVISTQPHGSRRGLLSSALRARPGDLNLTPVAGASWRLQAGREVHEP